MTDDDATSKRPVAEIAKDVYYEMVMLEAAALILTGMPGPSIGKEDTHPTVEPAPAAVWVALRNAVIESALVHARNLDDFFARKRRNHDDDVLAVDLADWKVRSLLTEEEREAINKHLQHLTYARAEWKAGWPLATWAAKFRGTYNQFTQCVTDPEIREVLDNGPPTPA